LDDQLIVFVVPGHGTELVEGEGYFIGGKLRLGEVLRLTPVAVDLNFFFSLV